MKKGVKILCALVGVGIPVYYAVGWQQRCIDRWKEEAEKQRAMFLLMSQWANLKQEGRSLEEYFLKNGYKKIAVYGMGVLGQRLAKELKASEIEIAYGIDNNRDIAFCDFPVISMKEDFLDADAIVVTVIKEFDVIREALLEKISSPVIAIEDVLDSL